MSHSFYYDLYASHVHGQSKRWSLSLGVLQPQRSQVSHGQSVSHSEAVANLLVVERWTYQSPSVLQRVDKHLTDIKTHYDSISCPRDVPKFMTWFMTNYRLRVSILPNNGLPIFFAQVVIAQPVIFSHFHFWKLFEHEITGRMTIASIEIQVNFFEEIVSIAFTNFSKIGFGLVRSLHRFGPRNNATNAYAKSSSPSS